MRSAPSTIVRIMHFATKRVALYFLRISLFTRRHDQYLQPGTLLRLHRVHILFIPPPSLQRPFNFLLTLIDLEQSVKNINTSTHVLSLVFRNQHVKVIIRRQRAIRYSVFRNWWGRTPACVICGITYNKIGNSKLKLPLLRFRDRYTLR